MNELLDTTMFLIPIIIVLGLATSCFIAGLKHRKELEGQRGWAMALYLMGILVCYLAYRDLTDGGFATPIIMGLILTGFLWFMAMLPLLSKANKDEES
jgi:hypothetical protein